MVVNVTRISQKMKNKGLMSIEKKYYRMRKKHLIIILKKCFNLENFLLFKEKYNNFLIFELKNVVPET